MPSARTRPSDAPYRHDAPTNTARALRTKLLVLVLLGFAVQAALAVVQMWVALSVTGYSLLAALLWMVGVYVVTRFFRGPSESEAARPWWRMTHGPLASALLGVLFVVIGCWPLLAGAGAALLAGFLPYLVLAALFFLSATLLFRTRRGSRPR